MFTDIATILVKAGKGGDGSVNFHREKFIASGGPDGGDGGAGGDVIIVIDDNLSTLLDFRYKRKYKAEDGQPGLPRRCSGKNGESVVIRVPRGTLLREAETGRLLADMSLDQPFVLAKGGRGGWGNTHFATPTRQAPHFAKNGLPGVELEVKLELKLLADVGLVGFPNVGKSSLLSVISAARPKIENYHFTTLIPNLGVVRVDEEQSFVCADIPGLIEGAAEGAGLGHAFLRHVERCRLLIHVIDVAGTEERDPCQDFDIIMGELESHMPELAKRPQLIAANKIDSLPEGSDNIERLVQHTGLPVFPISAVIGEGVQKLIRAAYEKLKTLPPVVIYTPEEVPVAPAETEAKTTITFEDGVWRVEGEWLLRLMGNINFSDHESTMYFERVLRKYGVFTALEDKGCEDGNIVHMYGYEYEYMS